MTNIRLKQDIIIIALVAIVAFVLFLISKKSEDGLDPISENSARVISENVPEEPVVNENNEKDSAVVAKDNLIDADLDTSKPEADLGDSIIPKVPGANLDTTSSNGIPSAANLSSSTTPSNRNFPLPDNLLLLEKELYDPKNKDGLQPLSSVAQDHLMEFDIKMFAYINSERGKHGLEPLEHFPTGMSSDELLQVMNGMLVLDGESPLAKMPMGETAPTPAELKEIREKAKSTPFIPPNKLGLQRLNEDREKHGLPPLTMEEAINERKEKIHNNK